MPKEFSVVSGCDKMVFRDAVNDRLAEGYQPVGGVSTSICATPSGEFKTVYALGMIRETSDKRS